MPTRPGGTARCACCACRYCHDAPLACVLAELPTWPALLAYLAEARAAGFLLTAAQAYDSDRLPPTPWPDPEPPASPRRAARAGAAAGPQGDGAAGGGGRRGRKRRGEGGPEEAEPPARRPRQQREQRRQEQRASPYPGVAPHGARLWCASVGLPAAGGAAQQVPLLLHADPAVAAVAGEVAAFWKLHVRRVDGKQQQPGRLHDA